MSAGHSEPQVLYSVNGISAYTVQNGEERSITPAGPQTLSLLMVPTSNAFADLSNTDPSSTAPEEDFYLHLHIAPELDLPLPATTQIYHKPPSSYLIPRWDMGSDAGAFVRIEFPSVGLGPGKVTQEEVDTFETILAQCTAFLERATRTPTGFERYNPSTYRPGEGYLDARPNNLKSEKQLLQQQSQQHGQIVLIDEENGSVIGELDQHFAITESANVKPGSKTPVTIQLPAEGQGNQITVDNVSEEYLSISRHPAYAKSTIVQSSATASRLIVTTAGFVSTAMTSGASTFQSKTKPNAKPMTFAPATHDRIRQIHSFTQGAVGLSAKTVGQLGKYAQNFGASLARKGEKAKKEPGAGYKPGILNKSMIAFSTIADGIDQAGRNLLASGSAAATNMVSHKYGAEAGKVAQGVAGGVKNVGLVYIDAMGVSRRAVIKSVAKGMVVGRMPDGKQLVVGGGDGGLVSGDVGPPEKRNDYYSGYGGASQAGEIRPGYGVESYGNAANPPPTYSAGIGEPMGGTLQGQNVREKR